MKQYKMGCAQTTGTASLSETEKIMKSFEDKLNYKALSAKDTTLHLKKFSVDNHLSLLQFKQAAESIGLEVDFETIDSFSRKFYQHFNNHSKYDTRKLIVLGILLGQGTSIEKATLLFEEWDVNCDAKAGNEEFSAMLEHLYDVAVDILPQIDPTIAENAETKAYLERVAAGKEVGMGSMKKKVMEQQESCDKAEFISKLAALNILNSHTFRTYLSAASGVAAQSDAAAS